MISGIAHMTHTFPSSAAQTSQAGSDQSTCSVTGGLPPTEKLIFNLNFNFAGGVCTSSQYLFHNPKIRVAGG
jgi:hypothetical protein